MYISNELTKTLAQRELQKGKYIKNCENDLFLHDRIGDPVKNPWPLIKMPKTYEQELAIKRNHQKMVDAMAAFDKANPFNYKP